MVDSSGFGPGFRSAAPFGVGAAALRSAATPWFTFSLNRYPPSLAIRKHAHDAPTLGVIVRGGFGATIVSSRRYDCVTSSMTVMPAGEAHEDVFGCGGSTDVLNVTIGSSFFDAYDAVPRLFDDFAHLRSPDVLRCGLRIRRELGAESGALRRLALDGLMLELLSTVCSGRAPSTPRPAPPWLRRVREVLHERATEPMSFGPLAREAGVSPGHLSAAFRRSFGCSPADYVRRVRVGIAARAIESTRLGLAEIAVESGFGDQSRLGKAFRRELGMTPGELRAAGRSERHFGAGPPAKR